MIHIRNTAVLVCVVGALGFGASAAQPSARDAAYDALPPGAPSDVARLFHSALDVPNVAEWIHQDRQALLDVVTLRYKNRLIDRAPAASPQHAKRHVERLAQSALALEFPNALRQTCAQYGLDDGACTQHQGFVRRALLLEEMLAQDRLTLAQMETELAGAPRLKRTAWQKATSDQ